MGTRKTVMVAIGSLALVVATAMPLIAEAEKTKAACSADKPACCVEKPKAAEAKGDCATVKPKCGKAKGNCAVTAKCGKSKAAVKQLAPQTICPIMGGSINKEQYVDHEGQRIYVCCGGCTSRVKAEPDAALKTLKQQGVVPASVPKEDKS